MIRKSVFVCLLLASAATAGEAQSSRTFLSANTIFHVSPGGTDDGSCGAAGAPCATLDHLVNRIVTEIDPLNKTVTVAVPAGVFEGFTMKGPLPGGAALTVQGTAGTVIHGQGRHAVTAMNGARLQLNDLTFTTSGAGNFRGVFATLNSYVSLGANIVFGPTTGEHLAVAYHSTLSMTQSYTVAGSATSHGHAFSHSTLSIAAGSTVTFVGTPRFSAYLFGASQGEILVSNVTMVGTLTTPMVAGCAVHYSSLLYKPGTTFPARTGPCVAEDASSNVVE